MDLPGGKLMNTSVIHNNGYLRFPHILIMLILVLLLVPACKDGSSRASSGSADLTDGDAGSNGTSSGFEITMWEPFYLQFAMPDSTIGVSISAAINATFNRNLDPFSLSPDSFLLTDVGNNAVAGSVTVKENEIIFTPSEALALDTIYTATVASLTSADGVPFSPPYAWSFTTAVTPQTIPSDGALDVPTDTAIELTLTSPMLAASLTDVSVFFNDLTNGTYGNGSASYDRQTHVVSVTPPFGLAPGADIRMWVTLYVTDAAGDILHFGYSVTFHTAVPAPPPAI
jgi:hypothetical protein